MERIRIDGGRKLRGDVTIGGAKNAALPEMAACLLSPDTIELENLPDVWDVGTMRRLLVELGARIEQPSASQMRVKVRSLASHEAPYELVKTMRASVLVLGPLLARFGEARVSLPGGCAIGARPIDLHLKGLEALGARVTLEHGFVEARADGLTGAPFDFEKVTVTGTENLMMAACLARGETILSNCAREPEVADLARLLRSMGAEIEGAGTSRIRIEGVPRLGRARHEVLPDRIEAGTYILAGALTGDDLLVRRCRTADLDALIRCLRRIGVPLEVSDDRVRTSRLPRLEPTDVETEPHPGFPTDMQAQLMVLLTQTSGLSSISEHIFENRFMHVAELGRMGAEIELAGNRAWIRGPTELSGAQVMATDLRASACLVLAGLVASDITIIDRVYHLDRGYEHIEEKLARLGASIERFTAK